MNIEAAMGRQTGPAPKARKADQTAVLFSPLPEAHLKPCHKKALRYIGIKDSDHYRGVVEFHPRDFKIPEVAHGQHESGWFAALIRTGLAAYAAEPFVGRLRERLQQDGVGSISWDGVLQEVLKDLPASQEDIHLRGAKWDATSYARYAMTITREAIQVDCLERIRFPEPPAVAEESETIEAPQP